MKRIVGCVLVLALLSFPAQAVLPIAFLAKEIVKSIVKDFLESQLNQMLAQAGPCGIPIAGTGDIASLVGMLSGRGGGMGGLSSLAGMGGGMPPIPGIGAAAKGALPNVPGLTGGGALASLPMGAMSSEQMAMMSRMGGTPGMGGAGMPPGMAEMMKSQMAQMEQSSGKEGADGRPSNTPDMAKVMQAMQDPTPLTAAEADELGTIMERMATAMPNAAPQCKPGELKTVMQRASDTPMGGGVMRMMLTSMREAQQRLDEARNTFATMSEAERADYVELMTTEYRGWDKENRQAMLGMLETNFLGMPESLKTQLVASLKEVK